MDTQTIANRLATQATNYYTKVSGESLSLGRLIVLNLSGNRSPQYPRGCHNEKLQKRVKLRNKDSEPEHARLLNIATE